MDGWVPKGNSGTPGLSADGAFERFLTAAIAAIITIMFSWRLLDDMNDQDLQREVHRGEKVDVHTQVKHTEDIDHDSILIDSDVSSRSESTKERMIIGNEIVSFESRQGMTSIINIDNDTDWERYQLECEQYSEHVELCGKKQGIESSNRGSLIAHSSVLTDKGLPFYSNSEPESQYQEANSDDDSYCCTLLEPILEEDSDDIFSASDEQESQRICVDEEMLPQWKVKPQAIYSDSSKESSKPEAAVEYQCNVSAQDASCDTVDAAHSQAALNIPTEGTGETKIDGGRSTKRTALNNSEFHVDRFAEHVQNHANITEAVLCASESANNIEILVEGNTMENGTKQPAMPYISEDYYLQGVASQEMNKNWICPQQQDSPRFGNKGLILDNVHLSMRPSEKCEEVSECNDDQMNISKQSFVLKKTNDQAEECEQLIHDGIVFNQETGSLIPSVENHNVNTKDCILPNSCSLEESTVTAPGTSSVVFSDLTSEDSALKSVLPVYPVGLSNNSNKNNEQNSDSISGDLHKFPGRCNHIAFNRAHVYNDAVISTAQEMTPHGFIFLQCESEQSRSERRTFLVDKPLYPDFDTFINNVPFTSEGFEEVHDWSLENDGYSDFVRELSRSDSVKDSACSSALQGMCPILSGNLISPLGSNAFEFPKHLVSSEANENTVTAESEVSEKKDEIASDISSDRSLVMRSDTLLSNSHLRERNAQYLDSSFTEDRLVNNDGRASQFAYLQDGDVLQLGPTKSETSAAEDIVDAYVPSTKYEGSLLKTGVSLQDQEHSLFENHIIIQDGPEVRCILESENKNLQVPKAEKTVQVDLASSKQSCFENKMSFDDSKDGAHDDKSRNSSVLQFEPMKSETFIAEKIVDEQVPSTKYEGSLLKSGVSLQEQEHYLFENHTILLAGPEARCISDSENKNLQVPKEETVQVDLATTKQSCFENKMSFDDSKDGALHDDESRNSSVLRIEPMKSETFTAEKIVDEQVPSTKYEGSLLKPGVSLQDQEHYLFENHTILLAGPETRCILDSENKNLLVPKEETVQVDLATTKQSCFENFDDSKDGAFHDDESRNSSYNDDNDNEISDESISCSETESFEGKHEEELHQHAYKHSYGEKRPRSLKEIRRKHAQQKSFMSVVQQNQPFRSFIGHFTIPDHLITPTKVKIMASRKKFLSAENLNESCTDSVQEQFDLHKMPKQESRERLYKSPKRLYKTQFNSQDQIEKLQNLINFSRKSETFLERPPIHHLHENCIFSPQGRRDVLNKTLSIENMQLPFPDESCKCVSLPSLVCTDVSGFDTSDGRLFFQTNHDVNACLFQQQPLERSASMSNLQSGSMLTSNEGILTSSSKKVGKGRFAHHQHKKSKSLCTLETNIDDVDTENTGNLMRVPSVHELRVSKSLQKLNVPDWFKQSSLSKSSSCLLKYGSNSTMNSFSFSPSLVSSPCASTAPPASNIVIKSRVLPPSSAYHLRSPRSLTTGVSDAKLPAPSVKLPSEKLRDKEKSKSLMPIPIVPFAQIRAMFESKSKKKQDIQHDTAKQTAAELPTVNVIDVGGENAETQNSLKTLSAVSEKRLYKNDSVSNSLASEKVGSDQKRTANLQNEGQGLQTEMRKTGADLQSSSPSTVQDNIINGKHTAQKPDLFQNERQEAQFERHQEKDPKAHSSMKSFKQLLGLSKDNSFDYNQQQKQTGFKLHKSAVYETEPRRLGVTQISLPSEARQEAQLITQTSNSDLKSKTLVIEAGNISQSVTSMSTKSGVTPAKEFSHIGKNTKGISSASRSSIHSFPGSPPMQDSVQPEPLHGGKSSSYSTAAVAHLDPKTTATRSLKETTV